MKHKTFVEKYAREIKHFGKIEKYKKYIYNFLAGSQWPVVVLPTFLLSRYFCENHFILLIKRNEHPSSFYLLETVYILYSVSNPPW